MCVGACCSDAYMPMRVLVLALVLVLVLALVSVLLACACAHRAHLVRRTRETCSSYFGHAV